METNFNYLAYQAAIKESNNQFVDYVNTYTTEYPIVDGEKYNFTSYSPEGEVWATGVAQVIAIVKRGLTKVKVLENSVEEFINRMFYITSDAEVGETHYELLDEEKNKTGIFIIIDGEYTKEQEPEELENPKEPEEVIPDSNSDSNTE